MENIRPRIALVGAGGASFGPVMTYETLRAEGLEGATLVMVDINEARLETARAAGQRMNEALGSPISIETETDTAKGIEGVDFIVLSVEVGRWAHWQNDYEIPRRHGSPQDMAENGGPGGLFHSLRTIKLVLEICSYIEERNPDAVLINVTNPLSRVNLAIDRATNIKTYGVCPEFQLGLLRLSAFFLVPPSKIAARASGMNHFCWFHELRHAETGKDLYPRLKAHVRMLPFMHGKLGRKYFEETGLYPVSSDSHIGEYLPYTGRNSRSVGKLMPYHQFSRIECSLRSRLTEWYARGRFDLPLDRLPASGEEGISIIEALATGEDAEFSAVNVPNREKYIPNLPDWAIVEVPARAAGGELVPEFMSPAHERLVGHMKLQYDIQSLIVDSVLEKDPAPAFEAFAADPLAPPTRAACRKAFDELVALQGDFLPF